MANCRSVHDTSKNIIKHGFIELAFYYSSSCFSVLVGWLRLPSVLNFSLILNLYKTHNPAGTIFVHRSFPCQAWRASQFVILAPILLQDKRLRDRVFNLLKDTYGNATRYPVKRKYRGNISMRILPWRSGTPAYFGRLAMEKPW